MTNCNSIFFVVSIPITGKFNLRIEGNGMAILMSQWKYMGVNSKAQHKQVIKTVPEVSSKKAEAQERGGRENVLLKQQRNFSRGYKLNQATGSHNLK